MSGNQYRIANKNGNCNPYRAPEWTKQQQLMSRKCDFILEKKRDLYIYHGQIVIKVQTSSIFLPNTANVHRSDHGMVPLKVEFVLGEYCCIFVGNFIKN